MATKAGSARSSQRRAGPHSRRARRVSRAGRKLITESYRDFARKQIAAEFASLNDFRRRWSEADRKRAIIDELEQHGVVIENLAAEVGKDLDPFDLILHVAYDQSRSRARSGRTRFASATISRNMATQARAVLEALLEKYQDEGVIDLDDPKVLRIAPFTGIGTPIQIVKQFGSPEKFEAAVHELQDALYKEAG